MLWVENMLPSWTCLKWQHKLSLERAEVLLQRLAEKPQGEAESLARVRSWFPVLRVVLRPHWLEIPLPVVGVKCRQEQ